MLAINNICQETISTWQLIGFFLVIIKIIIPLIIIVFGIIDVGSIIIKNPEKETQLVIKKITRRLAAALIIFFIPNIINASLKLFTGYKEQLDYKECRECFTNPTSNNCTQNVLKAKKAIEEDEKRLRDEIELKGNLDTDSLDEGTSSISSKNGQLDFSYEGNGTVKTQFSSDTLKIVEKHLYDLNYNNFNQVISSYGGFDKYVKSLGGVFSEYYGKEVNVTTEYEFQRVAEYVFGFMYMYGTDYINGSGEYQNWGVGLGESGHSDDAFYPGNMRVPHGSDWFDAEFDEVISGTGRHQDLIIATECGPAATTPLYKGGVLKRGEKPQVTYITRLQDLRPGDIMYFFDEPVGNKAIRSTWGRGRHNVLIGEVYEDKIVIYDAGRHFQTTRNLKREIGRPSTEAEEYAEVKKEFGFGGWAAERFNEGIIKHN